MAEISAGERSVPSISIRASPLAASTILYGHSDRCFETSGEENLRPISRLAA